MYRLSWLLLSGIFIAAGVLKIFAPTSFADAIRQMDLLPVWCENIVALGLPMFEVLCGLALLKRSWRSIGALGIAILNCLFIGVICQAWVRGLSFECGCFARFEIIPGAPGWHIARNLLLGAAAIHVYARKPPLCPASLPSKEAPPTF